MDVRGHFLAVFVVDNSDSMAVEQLALAKIFPRFIGVLETIPGPDNEPSLPNVHIGVISTDGKSIGVGQCGGNGGKLKVKDDSGLDPGQTFIKDILEEGHLLRGTQFRSMPRGPRVAPPGSLHPFPRHPGEFTWIRAA